MKKYSVCRFPSLYGSPWNTNWWILAYLYAYHLYLECQWEVRIINNQTGEHTVL